MKNIKHIIKAIGHLTSGKLNKELKKAIIKMIRNKMRKLISI